MRRNKSILLIIATFTSFAIFLIAFVIVKILNSLTEAPFSLNENYYSFNVNQYKDVWNTNTVESNDFLKENIYKLFYDYDNLIVIKESISYDRLSLYDPSGYYLNETVTGRYFSKEEFVFDNHNKIMVDEDSPYSRLIEKGKLYISGSYRDVIATYSSNYPLKRFIRGYYIIQPLAADYDLKGTYYVANCDDILIDNIISLFEDSGYTVSLTRNKTNLKNISFKDIFSRNESLVMIPSLLIILFADFITFCLLLLKTKRMINIHYQFGARNRPLFLYMIKEIIAMLVLGSIVGICIGSIFIFTIYKKIYFSAIIISSFISLILLLSVILIAFKYMKNKIVKEELR